MKKILCLLLLLWGAVLGGVATNSLADEATDKLTAQILNDVAGTSATFYDNQHQSLARLDLLDNYVDASGHEYIALQLKMRHGWKTYSDRADSGGLPPQLETNGSKNLATTKIIFPPDHEFSFQGIKSYGYKNAVTLPLAITRLDKNKNIDLKLRANFLICDVICVPATFTLHKTIAPPNAKSNNPMIAKAIATAQGNAVSDAASAASFARYILFALLGGLLLNILPCVLPALSLKLHHVQDKKATSARAIKKSIAITAFGLFSFFVVFGWGLYLLRLTHQQFFWGIYFQSPWFIALLLLLFAAIFLSSLKNFSLKPTIAISLISPRARTRLANITTRYSAVNDFLLGFVMAILSASCLAPLMSISLTFAFYQPNPIFIPLFVSVMGFGLALPWFLLSLMPQLYQWRLPTKYRGTILWLFNILVSASLFAIILWLVWLLKNTLGKVALLLPLLFFVSLLNHKKLFGKNNIVFIILSLLLLAPFLWAHYGTRATLNDATIAAKNSSKKLPWENFTADITSQANTARRPTLLVITADWCLTCQVNFKTVFASKEFSDWVAENNVRLVLADWTKPNKAIADFIAAEHRIGIPLTIFYDGHGGKKILPELLLRKNFYDVITKS
ncbi:MAG: protein-disulfide reductase DsbD family protein [Hydrotalea sp.]|nr:protein-disulfide reductase DsbD family protein [Hydrotalea sp.]